MKRLAAAFALYAFAAAAPAQAPSSPGPAPATEGARQSMQGSTLGTTPTNQPPQRGFIAPVVDIRIQGEGLLLPKQAPAAPQPVVETEKPAAQPTK